MRIFTLADPTCSPTLGGGIVDTRPECLATNWAVHGKFDATADADIFPKPPIVLPTEPRPRLLASASCVLHLTALVAMKRVTATTDDTATSIAARSSQRKQVCDHSRPR